MRSRVVQHFNLNVLSLVQCVLEHVMCIIDPRCIVLKKCEIRDSGDFDRIVSLLVDDRWFGFVGYSFAIRKIKFLRHLLQYLVFSSRIIDGYNSLGDHRLWPSLFLSFGAAAAEDLVSHFHVYCVSLD